MIEKLQLCVQPCKRIRHIFKIVLLSQKGLPSKTTKKKVPHFQISFTMPNAQNDIKYWYLEQFKVNK